MGLLSVLTRFGFDPACKARMARHQDGHIDFDALIENDQLDEYQRWQRRPVFKGAEVLVSFIGDGPKRARLWGVYRINGEPRRIPLNDIPPSVPGIRESEEPYYLYDMQRDPAFDPLADSLVVWWPGEVAWAQHFHDTKVLECPPLEDFNNPLPPQLITEGETVSEWVKSRRRSREARRLCLDEHGTVCKVCGLSFPEMYGGLGKGFMHVHHDTAVAGRVGVYQIDPLRDLSPVCPNCHAMLHWRVETPRTIAELRLLMGK